MPAVYWSPSPPPPRTSPGFIPQPAFSQVSWSSPVAHKQSPELHGWDQPSGIAPHHTFSLSPMWTLDAQKMPQSSFNRADDNSSMEGPALRLCHYEIQRVSVSIRNLPLHSPEVDRKMPWLFGYRTKTILWKLSSLIAFIWCQDLRIKKVNKSKPFHHTVKANQYSEFPRVSEKPCFTFKFYLKSHNWWIQDTLFPACQGSVGKRNWKKRISGPKSHRKSTQKQSLQSSLKCNALHTLTFGLTLIK